MINQKSCGHMLTISWKDESTLIINLPIMKGSLPGKGVLSEIRSIQSSIREAPERAPQWIVLRFASLPFCQSDLCEISRMLLSTEKEIIHEHIENYLDMLSENLEGLGANVLTVGIMEGSISAAAFGLALSCDLLVGNEDAACLFLEDCGNAALPPGAYDILKRKVGKETARDILSMRGRIDAETLRENGILCHLVADSDGDLFEDLMRTRNIDHQSMIAVRKSIQRACPFGKNQISESTANWIDSVTAHECSRLVESMIATRNRN